MKPKYFSARRWCGLYALAAACLVCGADAAAQELPDAPAPQSSYAPQGAATGRAGQAGTGHAGAGHDGTGHVGTAQGRSDPGQPDSGQPDGGHPDRSQPDPGQPGQPSSDSDGGGLGDHKHTAQTDGIQPTVSIPVAPLGFAPPAPFYLGDRLTQVSIDFLGEDKLLFTFRVPGLIEREHPASGGSDEGTPEEARNIRAVVLALPSGKVVAEALWRLHDFGPYLWVLQDHRFMLRDRNLLQIGDATLHLEPYLRFPGPVRYVEMDPQQQFLVTQSIEPPARTAEGGDAGAGATVASNGSPDSGPGTVLPSGSGADASSSGPKPDPDKENLLRVLRMRDHQVLLTTRTESGLVHLPLDGDGYYDALRGLGTKWMITYHSFSGEDAPILEVDSTCNPTLDTLAPGVVLSSGCTAYGGRRLTVITRDRRRLWETVIAPTRVWPTVVRDADGTRMARATLDVNHPISPTNPLDASDIHGQTVQVFDLATGKVVLTGPASPVLDGGGGFALSPSGRRFAVLNAGALQIYDLPAAPPLSGASDAKP